jgi:hypothetical protein
MGEDVSGEGCGLLEEMLLQLALFARRLKSDPSIPSSFQYGQDTRLHWRHVLTFWRPANHNG